MDKTALDFVFSVLPKGRTVFYDFADRYAVLLLTHSLGEGRQRIADLKQGDFAPLLSRPVIKKLLSELGRPWVVADDLLNAWPDDLDAYRLTLGTWPAQRETPRRAWHQVTRKGWSLVLQLNLPVSHRKRLDRTVEDWQEEIDCSSHPVAIPEELTLAWSRVDLDFDSNEALIEEIQSDWVRDVRRCSRAWWMPNREAWKAYLEDYLAPRAKLWQQTMLTATLWFLLEELGIKTIFYHTHDSGKRLKQIRGQPPRSIYTDLPRKYCFKTTHYGPRFIRDSKDRDLARLYSDPDTRWFIHDFR